MKDYSKVAANFYKSDKKEQLPSKHGKLLKYFWLVAEILGSVVTASLFFLITVCIINKDYLFFLTEYHTEPTIPAIVWFTTEVGMNLNKKIKCPNGSSVLVCDLFLPQSQPESTAAYLFYAPYLRRFPLPRDERTLWGLLHDESPINNLIFLQEGALNLFNFSATFNRHSDVPFPLNWMKGLDSLTSTHYYVNIHNKNMHLTSLAPIVYLQTNIHTFTERHSFVKELMKLVQVDAYGQSLHNKELPGHQIYNDPLRHSTSIKTLRTIYINDPELLQFLARYKFMIAIENAACNDYVSEKLWRALELGVVPIYFGSPLVRDWLPNNKSAILVEDYPTPELLSQHLHYLLQNHTAYEEYLTHKTSGKISNQKLINEVESRPYQTDFQQIVEKFECFICEKIHNAINSKGGDINMVSRKHFDCPLPGVARLSAPTTDVQFWRERFNNSTSRLDSIYAEIRSPDRTPRVSSNSWRPPKDYI